MAEEKNFENKVKTFLKENGCWSLKYWGGGEYTKIGVPDLLVCCNGWFVGVEVKSSKGRPSPQQIKNLRDIRNAGGFGILLYPKYQDYFFHLIENLKCGNMFQAKMANSYLDIEFRKWLEKYQKEGVLI